ncbi:hypothetical protein CPB83DRAFT_19700 [Crepidotus variabilis]|uniref:Uncharacterized protein n=1 Tax=Crepidotus variabilis TaxID=179855 RepID=A0A9P6JVL0_9AGAR|nr:hypothetical protein CPB83DRAFT_19700 [Crepidotus variabilis]
MHGFLISFPLLGTYNNVGNFVLTLFFQRTPSSDDSAVDSSILSSRTLSSTPVLFVGAVNLNFFSWLSRLSTRMKNHSPT